MSAAGPTPTSPRSQAVNSRCDQGFRDQPVKSGLAVGLAIAACQAGFSIYFKTLDDMVRQLREAEAAGRFAKKLQTYLKPSVLVLDEVGYLPLSRPEANMVFQLVSRRYERGSVICTSNKAFGEWGSVFGDDVLAAAILDRMLHHCEVISTGGTQSSSSARRCG
jgi:DNA replication protein DnaC